MQELLLIKNGVVIAQTNNLIYTDTYENYLIDGGEPLYGDVTSIDYNRTLQSCFINDELQSTYNNEYAERVLSTITELHNSFEARKEVTDKAETAAIFDKYELEAEEKEKQRLANMTLAEFKIENNDKVKSLIEDLFYSGFECSLGYLIGLSDNDFKLYQARICTMSDYDAVSFIDYSGVTHNNVTKANFITMQTEAYGEYLRFLDIETDYITRINSANDKEQVLSIISEIKSLIKR